MTEERDAENDSQPSPAQANRGNIVHPMDPRIDISRVGYLAVAPAAGQTTSHQQVAHSNSSAKTHDATPSVENYLQLMEVCSRCGYLEQLLSSLLIDSVSHCNNFNLAFNAWYSLECVGSRLFAHSLILME